MIPLNQPAPTEEFEEEPALEIDVDKTEPVNIKYFLGQVELFKRDGITVEVWGNKDDQNIA